ncbi:hypothetical protein DFH27DRAFT_526287 [Peziza echinospora]|nr:hypothetical protein DFH27DRAFT_526287 [Peziza echinospora]
MSLDEALVRSFSGASIEKEILTSRLPNSESTGLLDTSEVGENETAPPHSDSAASDSTSLEAPMDPNKSRVTLPLEIQERVLELFLLEHEKRILELRAKISSNEYPFDPPLDKRAPNRQISQLSLVSRWWLCDSLERLVQLVYLTKENPLLSTYTRQLVLSDVDSGSGFRNHMDGIPPTLGNPRSLWVSWEPTRMGQFADTVVFLMKQWQDERQNYYRPLDLSVTYNHSQGEHDLPRLPTIEELDEPRFTYIESLTINAVNCSHAYMRTMLPPAIHPGALLKLTRSENLRKIKIRGAAFDIVRNDNQNVPIVNGILDHDMLRRYNPRYQSQTTYTKAAASLNIFRLKEGPPRTLREVDLTIFNDKLPPGTPDRFSENLRKLSHQCQVFQLWIKNTSRELFLPESFVDNMDNKRDEELQVGVFGGPHMREYSVTISEYDTWGLRYISGSKSFPFPWGVQDFRTLPRSVEFEMKRFRPLVTAAITSLVRMPLIEFWELEMLTSAREEEERTMDFTLSLGRIRVVVGKEGKVPRLGNANAPACRRVKPGEVVCSYFSVFAPVINGEVEHMLRQRWPTIRFEVR